jgi:hypothetical protein
MGLTCKKSYQILKIYMIVKYGDLAMKISDLGSSINNGALQNPSNSHSFDHRKTNGDLGYPKFGESPGIIGSQPGEFIQVDGLGLPLYFVGYDAPKRCESLALHIRGRWGLWTWDFLQRIPCENLTWLESQDFQWTNH